MHTESTFEQFLQEITKMLQTFKIRTDNGTREWQAENKEHAIEQHDDSFKTDGRYHDGERIEDVALATASQPYFKVGDRCFSHYTRHLSAGISGWGTISGFNTTYRDQTHGVTGSKLPDTTWYDVKADEGHTELLDDAHGNWDMCRIMPPHIAKRFGYGDDPKGTK